MVGDFERLAQEFVESTAPLQYRLCGETDARGRGRIRAMVKGRLEMVCQRCLQPVEVVIDSERLLYLAATEEDAERIEAVLQDEDIEVVVTGKTLDLAGLVEDEVLLSVPVVPMHQACESAGA